jgi:rod shape-determining protein MreC
MSQLFRLFYKWRNFFLFIFLEVISFALIRNNSVFWDVTMFNSSNYIAGNTMQATSNLTNYMSLTDVNKQLSDENVALRKMLTDLQQGSSISGLNYKADSVFSKRFSYKVAKVVNNTVNLTNNYITIDKGTLDGLKPGMGVICPQGVVGQVLSCNEHFSTVYSILHSRFTVSSEVLNRKLRKENLTALGIAKWEGPSPRIIQLNTIDRTKPIFIGDSVVTSEQNAIFPGKILIGKIRRFNTSNQDAFYKIDVKLSTEFRNLTYVYVIDNKLIKEQKALEIEAAAIE